MSSRAVSTREGSRVPSTARLLLGGALVLALTATLVLVLSDDARFLKLGILAALWAALVGAFLAARFRRQVADNEDESASMQTIYELELEREIAARREFELQLEAEAKRKAEEQSRQDIEALRTELGQLRETLQGLLGGEVLVERFALQAQATRMRSLPDEAHQIPGQNLMLKRLSPAQAAPNQQVIIPADPKTEMIGQRLDGRPPQQRPEQRPQQQRPPRSPADRQVQVSQPQPRDEDPGSGWWEPVTPPGAAGRRQEYRQPVAGDSVNSLGEGIDMSWTPSWERANGPQPPRPQNGRPARPPKAPEPQPSRPLPNPAEAETRVQAPVRRPAEPPTQVQPLPEPPVAARPPEPPARKAENSMRGAPVRPPAEGSMRGMSPVPPPARDGSMRGMSPVPPPGRDGSMRGVPPVQPPARAADGSMRGVSPVPPPPGPDGSMRGVSPVQPPARMAENSMRGVAPVRPPESPDKGGRRRADESSGGGRRRRADDAPPWQETLQANGRHSGTHAKPAPADASGSHAEGKSVNELLAAYGSTGETPRRRRRRDD